MKFHFSYAFNCFLSRSVVPQWTWKICEIYQLHIFHIRLMKHDSNPPAIWAVDRCISPLSTRSERPSSKLFSRLGVVLECNTTMCVIMSACAHRPFHWVIKGSVSCPFVLSWPENCSARTGNVVRRGGGGGGGSVSANKKRESYVKEVEKRL